MQTTMRRLISILAEAYDFPEPIYEFGSLQVPGQKDRADLRPFFAGKKYVGGDIQKGPGVDRVLNLHDIDLAGGSAGSVLLIDTLEHVEYCRRALDEVYRILKPGGILVINSVMYFPIHNYPSDYWRFTPAAFKSLLSKFQVSMVESVGLADFPHTIVGVAFKGKVPNKTVKLFRQKLLDWKRSSGRSWKETASIILPLFMLVYLYKAYRRLEELTERILGK